MTSETPSITFLLLCNLEQSFLIALGNSLIEKIESHKNDLSQEEIIYWIERLGIIQDMAQADINALKIGAAFFDTREAVNTIVPFVNQGDLN